ncbi:fasciclin domain-containing protein [Adhaeretor mobilis]|uniref:Immunogenic protein MPT70 n=1 Tax=Adhaeretor mobilis TaxID=1930276 RepID=A0A517MPT9_9BACT|nr:fasciclin domain-containing protein [Adhaeretor mobilis]QDS96889.1 Immunogenic protein MPT70 precursor [Adhaeretor mobilis]
MSYLSKQSLVCLALAAALVTSNSHAASKDIVDTAVGAGSFKTLAAALQAADLVGALKGKGPFTVLAPTDEAFAKLPKGTLDTLLKPENKQKLIDVLTYHVIKGKVPAKQVVTLSGAKTLNGQQVDIKVTDGKVSVDKANVVKTDIDCTNGVIHVIDQVILPASDNIPTTATKAGNFKTLLAAAQAAGLVDALSAKGPLTVFAPTDEAFANLPAGTVESLLKPENKAKLVAILKYHVVPGRVYSSDALAAGSAKTLQGQSVNIALKDKVAMVNAAKLLATDVDASNGVIHVIDSVILPPDAKQSAVEPHRMIETAIHKGAPLFNAGHPSECASVYMTTVKDLLEMEGHGLCPTTTQALQTALTQAESTGCSNTQAWTLRHALDSAYNSMQVSR